MDNMHTYTEYTFPNGNTIKCTVAFRFLPKLREQNKRIYTKLNHALINGVEELLETAYILYGSYLCKELQIMKKLLILLLTLTLCTVLFACGGDTPCTEHVDADGNGKCDVCDTTVDPSGSEGGTTYTRHNTI